MGARTYIPQLIKIVYTVCKYATRYRSQILEHLPPAAVAPFNTLADNCQTLLDAIGVLPIGD